MHAAPAFLAAKHRSSVGRVLLLLALVGGEACAVPPATASPASLPSALALPEPIPLRFADFYETPVGPQGLVPSAKLAAADGREVQLRGWMVAQEASPRGYFLLTARPVRLSEHADGEADDLPAATVLVRLPPAPASRPWPLQAHQPGLIELTGTLRVGRSVEPDGRVSWLQLLLH